MPIKKRNAQKELLGMGFKENKKHHISYEYYTIAGARTKIRTYVSHGSKSNTIDDRIVSRMAIQCGLTKSEFIKLVNGDMSREEYERILRDKNLIPPA